MCKSKGKNVCKPQDQIFVIQIKKLFKNVFWYFLTMIVWLIWKIIKQNVIKTYNVICMTWILVWLKISPKEYGLQQGLFYLLILIVKRF